MDPNKIPEHVWVGINRSIDITLMVLMATLVVIGLLLTAAGDSLAGLLSQETKIRLGIDSPANIRRGVQ